MSDDGNGQARRIGRRAVLRGAASAVGAALLAACGGATLDPTPAGRIGPLPTAVSSAAPRGPSACVMGNIAAAGSTALQPLVDAAAKAYAARCMGAQIAVRGGGSDAGLAAAQSGTAQIGASDIFAEEQRAPVMGTTITPAQLADFVVAVQGFAVVVNVQNPLVTLTQAQLVRIFTGGVTNFSDVGGPKQAITVVNRERGSGTRTTFERFGLGRGATTGAERTSTGMVAMDVSQNVGAIGYVGLAALATNPGLRVVLLNGREPTVENISDDSYPVWSYGHLYTKGEPMGLTKAFLDYLLSDDVQTTLVPQLGYIPVSRVKARKTPV